MSEKPTREQEIQRADEARRLRAHPMLKEAFDGLRKRYYDEFLETKPGDPAIERLHHAAAILNEVETHLSIIIGAGDVAKAHLERLKTGAVKAR